MLEPEQHLGRVEARHLLGEHLLLAQVVEEHPAGNKLHHEVQLQRRLRRRRAHAGRKREQERERKVYVR
eukprot:6183558-Pleurochrysis_carterae.AAC.1